MTDPYEKAVIRGLLPVYQTHRAIVWELNPWFAAMAYCREAFAS